MKKAIIGKKLGMTQIFSAEGHVVPVTVVEAGPCTVVQKKTVEHDGYDAIQVGFEAIREKLANKPRKGQFSKAGASPARYLRELKLEDSANYEVGATIKADMFSEGDIVDVSGFTKGHGFTGTIYRWNQSRGPMSHGSKYHRGPGSMSACASPSRVFKNKKLPGQYGHENVTIQNLKVVRVDTERNLLLVKGALPGPNGGLVVVRDAIKS